jgi:hypothetical protein
MVQYKVVIRMTKPQRGVNEKHAKELEDKLNEHSKDGWRYHSMTSFYLIFEKDT